MLHESVRQIKYAPLPVRERIDHHPGQSRVALGLDGRCAVLEGFLHEGDRRAPAFSHTSPACSDVPVPGKALPSITRHSWFGGFHITHESPELHTKSRRAAC